MATTTNFGWETPDDTDLVKDGAAAIRTLGQSIDTSLMDLEGGTTGQVLSKASNADMDFTWVAQDDSNAIQNAIVDAKGDLIAATGADTPARLAVGTNGQILTADSTAATGLKWATAGGTAGFTCVKAETAFSAVSSVTADSVFTSTYTSYRVIINYTTSSTGSLSLKLRSGGTSTSSNYNFQFMEVNGTGVSGARVTGSSSIVASEWTNGANNSTAVIDIFNPQVATATTYQSHGDTSLGALTTPFIKISYGNQSDSTQFDGLEILNSGTITGNYTIYGYGKTL
jgi:hypothetical protein